ncbi:lipopolysaccharide-induced tumor necrosis factor-alpha factor homolog [Atheta coriaria]|uniref:lipopolysaccharide-induced tumor necrosis factor-alpha factor homolog n=1 Tax=Dalotia coriaria TaxID=877792 RepID=UPI0031F45152
MEKNGMDPPPAYMQQPPPLMPPSYSQAMAGSIPLNPYTPVEPFQNGPRIMTTVVPLGPEQTRMICPHCQTDIYTTRKVKPKPAAYLSCALIFMFGCFLGCCLIPFCMNSCRSVSHSCPNCGRHLGKYLGNE